MPLRFQKIHLKRWLLMQWALYMFRTFRGNRRQHIMGCVVVFFKENTSLCSNYFYVFSALPEGPSSAPQRSITDRRSQELAPFEDRT